MERDPLRYVWAATRGLHVAGFALVLICVPAVWIVIDLVRVALDDVVAGAAFAGQAATTPFLRLALTLPERLREDPLVLSSGWALSRGGLAAAVSATLLAAAALGALVSMALGALRSRIRERVTGRLRQRILDAVVSARSSAADEARRAAALAGEGMAREDGFLGGALLTPAAAIAALVGGVAYVAATDWRLAGPLACGLILFALAWPRRTRAARKIAEARLVEGAALRRSLLDLVRRLPALRAHGTAALEREGFARNLLGRSAPVRHLERRGGVLVALAIFAALLALVAILAGAGLLSLQRAVSPGEVTAALAAAALALAALERFLHWRGVLAGARPVFEEIAQALGRLQSRAAGRESDGALPEAGQIAIDGLVAYDPATGARLSGLDIAFDLHAHVALVGSPGSGAPLLAAVLGGRLDPSEGQVTLGGADLIEAAAAERARRIAYAGGRTILVPGSLRANLLYGCADPDAPDIEQRLIGAVIATGLDHCVQARSLAGRLDADLEPALAEALVEARGAVRAAIEATGREMLVDPFDAGRYNRHATIGENIFFGVPLGDTFREANLPSHSFVREILRVEGLAEPLSEMGLAIAGSMVEMFADLPDGSPLIERFSFFSPAERPYFEDLIRRRQERRVGADAPRDRDRDRLIALALPYCESRHRLGLLQPEMQARLLRVRAAFAERIPVSLRPAIEFFDPRRISQAASIQDNLLFGRIVQDRAGAEEEVRRVLWRVLSERELVLGMFRIGLETHVDSRGSDLAPGEVAAIDVARCLMRRTGTVVIEHALDGLTAAEADLRVARLRSALGDRGLVLVTSDLTAAMDEPPFALVIRFERGAGARIERRA